MVIKVLQINIGKSISAANLMIRKAKTQNYDVLLIQEPYPKFKGIFGYEMFKSSEDSVKVITYVKRGTGKVWLRNDILNKNVVLIELELENDKRSIIIANIYDEPPENPNTNTDSKFQDIIPWFQNRKEKMIIAGDFNAKNTIWGGTINNRRGKDLYDWAIMEGWRLENNNSDPASFYSSVGQSWIDLIFTKNLKICDRNIDTEEDSLSDHRYITYFLDVGKIDKLKYKLRYKVKNVDWNKFQNKVKSKWNISETNFKNLSAEDKAITIQNKTEEICSEELVKKKGYRKNEKEWWNAELEDERRETRRSRKRFQEEQDADEKENLRIIYINRRNIYKKKIKEAKIKNMEEELDEMGDNVWNICKRWIKGGSIGIPGNMKKEDGTYTESLEEIHKELVKKYFPKDYKKNDDPEHKEMRNKYDENIEEEEDYEVTLSELNGIIGGMSKRKAPGQDGIPNECIKYIANEIGEELRETMNNCMKQGIFPKIWKKAEVIWLPKEGGGMRPISLLGSVGKVLDRILANRISFEMENKNKFDNNQYGFRKNRDCIQAIDVLINIIKLNKENKLHSLIIALDLKNAFGSAWSPSVIKNMRDNGLSEELVKMVKSFMKERKICVEGKEWCSDVGCPQGSSLGPVLWLLVMEGWFKKMNEARKRGVHVQAYADDQIIIISKSSLIEVENEWNIVWQECKEWARINKLEYNISKTEMMFISYKKGHSITRNPRIKMNNINIELKNKIKYLGIYIDKNITWLDHLKIKRAKILNFGLKFLAIGRKKWGNSKKVLKIIYERVICAIILYGAEIWGENATNSKIVKQLRAIERPFLKSITKCYNTAPTASLSILSGCVPLEIQARSKYEKRRNWYTLTRKISIQDRQHPAIRGYVPITREELNERIQIWTDATIKEDGRKAYAWMTSINGIIEKGGSCINGEIGITELEGWAVWKGILKGIENRRDKKEILICTDSEQVVKQIKYFETKWLIIGKIQKEIVTGLEKGYKVIIEWRGRNTDGIKIVDKECKRILREGRIIERIEGVSKNFVKKWTKDWEIREWQNLWDNGTTGRWTHELWSIVNTSGCDTTFELTQIATGHGNFKSYLNRFKLNGNEGNRCECGNEESVRHIVFYCNLNRRKRAREKLERTLGYYPPRLNEINVDNWPDVIDWAKELLLV